MADAVIEARSWMVLVLGVALAFLVSLGASIASADTTYTIDVGNPGGLNCCTGPYATATVHFVDATHATVTFTSATNGGYLYLMAGNQAADVNVNATSFTVGSLSGSNSVGFSPVGPLSNGGSNNVDGFGSFNLPSGH